jgi:hypothetical protein
MSITDRPSLSPTPHNIHSRILNHYNLHKATVMVLDSLGCIPHLLRVVAPEAVLHILQIGNPLAARPMAIALAYFRRPIQQSEVACQRRTKMLRMVSPGGAALVTFILAINL